MTDDLVVVTNGPEETRSFAERLGKLLRAGDTLCLTGGLGAGKTTFTQGLAIGLGLPPDHTVNSPTYTLVAEHPGGRAPLYHFDVYRLADARELYDLAFDEYLDGSGVTVIEWADKITNALPTNRLDITIETNSLESRRLTLTPCGDRAKLILAGLQ